MLILDVPRVDVVDRDDAERFDRIECDDRSEGEEEVV
jgi:hypothetical protein